MRRKKLNPGRGRSKRMDPGAIARFLAKVSVSAEGCWLWAGHVDEKGYGQFKWAGRAWWAHRISYVTFRGRIRNGNEIDHSRCPCRERRCVNPDHLAQTTHQINSREGARHQALKEVPF